MIKCAICNNLAEDGALIYAKTKNLPICKKCDKLLEQGAIDSKVLEKVLNK